MDPQLSELMKRRRKKDSTSSTGSSGRPSRKSLSSTIGSTDSLTEASGGVTVASGSTAESSESRERRREERRSQRKASSNTAGSADGTTVATSGSGPSRRRPDGERDRTVKPRRKKSSMQAPASISREASGTSASSTSSRGHRKSHGSEETNNQDNNDESSDEEGEQTKSNEEENEEEHESSDEEPGFPPTSSGDTPDFAAAFGDANLDFTAAPTTAIASTFDPSAFASFDTFPLETLDTVKDAAQDAGIAFEYTPPSFALPPPPPPSPPKKVHDTTPLVNPPVYNNPANHSFLTEKPRKLASSAPGLPPPAINPLNGHWIVCQTNPTNGEKYLCQVDPHTGAQVLSVPLLSTELQRKVATKYGVSATAVDSVLHISVGVHKAKSEGITTTRPRVACLMDLLVLDNTEVLRVVAIWQWGYATSGHPIALQSVLSPPSGSDFIYNPLSLLVADSCVFVSGASAKGPCVFLCKPTVRETWSANFVGKEAARIACMSVTKSSALAEGGPNNPYLAIALTDGSLSVWTYAAAMQMTSKTTEVVRRLLYPLCRLEGNRVLMKCSATGWEDKSGKSSPSKYLSCICKIHPFVDSSSQCFSSFLQAIPRRVRLGIVLISNGFLQGRHFLLFRCWLRPFKVVFRCIMLPFLSCFNLENCNRCDLLRHQHNYLRHLNSNLGELQDGRMFITWLKYLGWIWDPMLCLLSLFS
jgi:hypothetical protein